MKSALTIRNDCKRRLGIETVADYAQLVLWTDAEVDRYVQQGYDDLVTRSLLLWKQAWINDTARVDTYPLPADLYLVERIVWDARKLDQVSSRDLWERDSRFSWTPAGAVEIPGSGQPYVYCVEGDGNTRIRKYPTPSASALNSETDIDTTRASNTRIEYYAAAPALSAGTILDMPDVYVRYVMWYALSRCYEHDGPGQDMVMAAHYRDRYEDGVNRVLRRRQDIRRTKVLVAGGGPQIVERRGGPPRPRLPWNYGRVVPRRG